MNKPDYYSAHIEVCNNNFSEARNRLNDDEGPIKIKINRILALMDECEEELQDKLNMDDVSDDYYSAHIEVCNNNFSEARNRLNGDKDPIKIKINRILALMDEVEEELQAKLNEENQE